MVTDDTKQAKALLEAIGKARHYLHGPGTPKSRRGAAQNCLYSYRNTGILAAHVRDVCQQTTLRATESALDTLENLARGFATDGEKADEKARS